MGIEHVTDGLKTESERFNMPKNLRWYENETSKKTVTMTKEMKSLLTLEETGMFLLSIFLFSQLDYKWWMFPACLLLHDL